MREPIPAGLIWRPAGGADLADLGSACEGLGDVGRAWKGWAEALRIYEEIEDPHAGWVRGWPAEHDTDSHG
jgi:hypothetical protein